jgi:sugar lactone lactonase YvrE
MDAEHGLVVCPGIGVWGFEANGLAPHLAQADGHGRLTNIAFGGPGRKTLSITESANGDLLTGQAPVAGTVMFGLAG